MHGSGVNNMAGQHDKELDMLITALLGKAARAKGGGGVNIDVVVGWKAGTTPDPAKIPAGVTVTYQGTTYTGTKAASESTKGQIVLVALPDGTQPNLYTEYITYKDGNTYGWEAIGTTQVDLTDYYTKTEADARFITSGDLIPQGTLTMYSIAQPTVAETYDIYIRAHQ